MASGVIDQIKERVDVVDLISSYLKLQKSGINYKARCPFHNEKSASFFVSPERQIWHCFGCSAGGDVFGFIKQIEGVEFPEALRILAARAGVKLERQSPEYEQFQSAKTKLYEICELAMRFFEKQLRESAIGKQALAYLCERGLIDESIKEFHLGYAPDSWNALYDFLGRNYDSKEIFDAGLIVKKDLPAQAGGGGYFDRFRSRIMFPIFDINGQTVGFTGRIFEYKDTRGLTQTNTQINAEIISVNQRDVSENQRKSEVAKYINTPQTLIYDKSRILYGLDKAKLDIRRASRCLVVEGNMDVIMSHQAGAKHVVASSGTALTDSHLKIIKRYTDNLDLCFDADNAGELARDRGVDLALARGFNVGIVTVGSPRESVSNQRESAVLKDPADYVKIYGAKWAEVSQKSKPFMDFYFETAKSTLDLATALGKKLFGQRLMPLLASMANKIEQSHWVSEIALALKTKEEILYQELSSTKLREGVYVESDARPTASSQKPEASLDPVEETLLSLVLKKPELVSNITPDFEQYLSEQFKKLLSVINKKEPEVTLAVSSDPSLQPSVLDFINLKSQELWKDFKDSELEDEFKKLLGQIKRKKISEQLTSLEYDIKTAEKAKEKERLSALMAEFSKISRELGD